MSNSKHSYERASERFGLNEPQTDNFTRRALERGLHAESMPKKEREYMKKKESAGAEIVYYNGVFLIFGDCGSCITMYEAPSWFGRKRFYSGKEQIRNAKKYQRYEPFANLATAWM